MHTTKHSHKSLFMCAVCMRIYVHAYEDKIGKEPLKSADNGISKSILCKTLVRRGKSRFGN